MTWTLLARIPGGSFSAAAAINDFGLIVGKSGKPDGGVSGAAWWDSAPEGALELESLGPGLSSVAYDVNNLGQVVGVSEEVVGSVRKLVAVLWTVDSAAKTASRAVRLPPPAGSSPNTRYLAYAINDLGQIAGSAQTSAGGQIATCAVLWRRDPATGAITGPLELPSLTGKASSARFIDDCGRITGEADDSKGAFHGFLWIVDREGMLVQATDLGGLSATRRSMARAVNSAGLVVGEAAGMDGVTRPICWALQGGKGTLLSLPGACGGAAAINASGRIAGWTGDVTPSASVWAKGLAGLDRFDPVFEQARAGICGPSRALDINERGQVVGSVLAANGKWGFFATPKGGDR